MAKKKVSNANAEPAVGDPRRLAFERLFVRRIQALKEDARLLMNLSNPYNYSYGVDDVEILKGELNKIHRAIIDEYDRYLPNQKSLTMRRGKGSSPKTR